ncbi:MAG: hypothetical protein M0R80_02940 [Proteobacteria bacterium]|jgi:DNA-directed RNA polymerase subunit M/transcription elongation factor TFIIS|nr:hypothetical protein [Pseudomonadota bacterium]
MGEIYQLFCNNCCWKRISENLEAKDLTEVKTTDVPKGIPHIDPVNGDMIIPKPLKRNKKYKCPNCGFVIIPRKIENPQENVEQNMDMQRRIQKRLENDEKEKVKQLEREQLKKQRGADGSETSPGRRTL